MTEKMDDVHMLESSPHLSQTVEIPRISSLEDRLNLGDTSDDKAPTILSGRIEVCQKLSSVAKSQTIKEHVMQELASCKFQWQDFILKEFTDPFLNDHVDYIAVCDTEPCRNGVAWEKLLHVAQNELHIFQLQEGGSTQEELEDEESLAASNNWLLPSPDFQGLWENLVFDDDIKANLLQYARTMMLFSEKGVDPNVVTWNRLILLHGPPGTGKTSLCKALAQKLSIILSNRYKYGQLIEINSHSLFSKWFSESGKLVMKMFKKIQDIVSDPDALVCVLIDEVESLSASRQAMSGSEPSDAIRVVNSLLTQLDAIKRNPNVLILTTSNITGAIDVAFLDRADIRQYIGPPSEAGIYQIYFSCIQELMKAGIIIAKETLLDRRATEMMSLFKVEYTIPKLTQELQMISRASVGISGRTLRKLPLIAHALYIRTPVVTLEKFLKALSASVEQHIKEGVQAGILSQNGNHGCHFGKTNV